MAEREDSPAVGALMDTPHLAEALESDRFKQFLDQLPLAVAVAELHPSERVTYANLEFERLTGQTAGSVQGKPWGVLNVIATAAEGRKLSDAIAADEDYIGAFDLDGEGGALSVDAWSNIIQDDDGHPIFRLVALAEVRRSDSALLEHQIQEKDILLQELQHRVKNNLQMITALIRLEARNAPDQTDGEPFDRLAGRVGALAILYQTLSDDSFSESVDLGVYLSQIASAVMQAHAVEGIHLNLQVDTWPVSINVAMPAGLVVNEVLTNSLKHAFIGREGGTISLHSLIDETGCRVIISDDGVGLAEGAVWPKPGRLGVLIVQSLRQNAQATVDVVSSPGSGMKVTVFFARADASPQMD